MGRALGKNYALNLNYLQLNEGRVIVTVQCGANDVRFRVVARLVHAELVEGEHQIGANYYYGYGLLFATLITTDN